MDAGFTAAAMAHIVMGATYFGATVVGEAIVLPGLRRAANVGELRVYQSVLSKLGPMISATGMLTLITGIVYLLAKYGTDFAVMWGIPPARTLVIALIIFLVLATVGIAFLTPSAMWLAKKDLGSDLAALVPDEVKMRVEKLAGVSHAQSAGVLVVLVLMVVAAKGGI